MYAIPTIALFYRDFRRVEIYLNRLKIQAYILKTLRVLQLVIFGKERTEQPTL